MSDQANMGRGFMNAQPVLLAVDDNRDNLYVIEKMLKTYIPDCALITAVNGADAYDLTTREQPAGILLDVLTMLCRLHQ